MLDPEAGTELEGKSDVDVGVEAGADVGADDRLGGVGIEDISRCVVIGAVGTTTGPVPDGTNNVATIVGWVSGAALATSEHKLYALDTASSASC